jgi:hypothetical protein
LQLDFRFTIFDFFFIFIHIWRFATHLAFLNFWIRPLDHGELFLVSKCLLRRDQGPAVSGCLCWPVMGHLSGSQSQRGALAWPCHGTPSAEAEDDSFTQYLLRRDPPPDTTRHMLSRRQVGRWEGSGQCSAVERSADNRPNGVLNAGGRVAARLHALHASPHGGGPNGNQTVWNGHQLATTQKGPNAYEALQDIVYIWQPSQIHFGMLQNSHTVYQIGCVHLFYNELCSIIPDMILT